jgi:hypothetical protein
MSRPELTRAVHGRTNSQNLAPLKSILKKKESETPATYASSPSTHTTPDSIEVMRTDPGWDIDYSDPEDVVRKIISEKRVAQRTQREPTSYLDSLRMNMQAMLSQDTQQANKVELRRRHIKNQLLSAFVSHSDNDFEEPITPRLEANYSSSRPVLTKPDRPTIVRPIALTGGGWLTKTHSIDTEEEHKRVSYRPTRRSEEMPNRASKY